MTPDLADLADRMREHAAECAAESPLMEALIAGAAQDLDDGGPTADLLAAHAGDPAGSMPSLRLAAALHRLVLERHAPLLATHYPSVGGTAEPSALWPAARDAIATHGAQLARWLRHPVQTNEIGRCAALLGVLAQVADDGLPVRLLEVGASAGLNLRADAVGLRVQGRVRGPVDSPVVLEEPWSGVLPPDRRPAVLERLGCDPHPLDPTSAEGRMRLSSTVWADQRARFQQLRAALALATRVPAVVEQRAAADFLAHHLARPAPGLRTVVWHSLVRQYLDQDERTRVGRLLQEAGERATPTAPLLHLSVEPEQADGRGAVLVRVTQWPSGQERVVATAGRHGPPVEWR